MKILIIGGCFTCQHNIDSTRLYHQSLKKMLVAHGVKNTEIATLRYERIGKTFEKIVSFQKTQGFDLLVFHLRTEPFMRLVKLHYRYLNYKNELKHSLNLPFFNVLKPEEFDMLATRKINISTNLHETKFRYYLRELNYILGSLLGNKQKAIEIYEKFVNDIATYCYSTNKKFLLLGPASRPFSKFENRLSHQIDTYFSSYAKIRAISYLELLGERTSKNEKMFFPNGKHVSQEGHDDVALKLYKKITNTHIV